MSLSPWQGRNVGGGAAGTALVLFRLPMETHSSFTGALPWTPLLLTDTGLHPRSQGAPLQAEPLSGRPKGLDSQVPCRW